MWQSGSVSQTWYTKLSLVVLTAVMHVVVGAIRVEGQRAVQRCAHRSRRHRQRVRFRVAVIRQKTRSRLVQRAAFRHAARVVHRHRRIVSPG